MPPPPGSLPRRILNLPRFPEHTHSPTGHTPHAEMGYLSPWTPRSGSSLSYPTPHTHSARVPEIWLNVSEQKRNTELDPEWGQGWTDRKGQRASQTPPTPPPFPHLGTPGWGSTRGPSGARGSPGHQERAWGAHTGGCGCGCPACHRSGSRGSTDPRGRSHQQPWSRPPWSRTASRVHRSWGEGVRMRGRQLGPQEKGVQADTSAPKGEETELGWGGGWRKGCRAAQGPSTHPLTP